MIELHYGNWGAFVFDCEQVEVVWRRWQHSRRFAPLDQRVASNYFGSLRIKRERLWWFLAA